MTPDELAAEFGEFARFARIRIMMVHLPPQFLKGAVLLVPTNLFVGATMAYGLPIVRADVPEPMLGISGGEL